MLQLTIRCTVVALFLFSNNLLMMMGWGFNSPTGGFMASIHPSTYLAAIGVLATFLLPDRKKALEDSTLPKLHAPLLLAAVGSLLLALYLDRKATGAVGALIVTYLTPALVIYLLQFSDRSERTGAFILNFVRLFLLANTVIGIGEYVTGLRLLTFYAGTEVLTNDLRPTALLGHPLLNAMLTTCWLITLLARQIHTGFSGKTILEAGLHAMAIPCYGGRASSVIGLIIIVLYFIGNTGLIKRKSAKNAERVFLFFVLGFLALVAIASSGFMDSLLDRFVNAEKSTQTRYAAIQLLDMLKYSEWLLGVDVLARQIYLDILQTPFGIESAPLALVFAYGLPVAAGLLIATYWMLVKLARSAGPGARYVALFFVFTTATALTIGSKSLLVSQIVCILYASRYWAKLDQAAAARRSPPAGAMPAAALRPQRA